MHSCCQENVKILFKEYVVNIFSHWPVEGGGVGVRFPSILLLHLESSNSEIPAQNYVSLANKELSLCYSQS